MININDTVKYKGENRPYLNGLSGKVISKNSTSAFVDFSDPKTRRTLSEWVGLGALESVEVDKNLENIKSRIRNDKLIIDNQITDLNKKLDELNAKSESYGKALKALEAM